MAVPSSSRHGRHGRHGKGSSVQELSKAAFKGCADVATNGALWGAMSLAICIKFLDGARKGYLRSVKENFGPDAYEEAPQAEASPERPVEFEERLADLWRSVAWNFEGAVNVASDVVAGGRKTASHLKRQFTPDEMKVLKAGNRTMYVACAIAAVWMMRGHWMEKNPYLDLALTADTDTTPFNPYEGRRSTDPTVDPVEKFKNIPAVLVVCADSAQFDIVVGDFQRRIDDGANISYIFPPQEKIETENGSEMRDGVDKVYIVKKHDPRSDLQRDVFYIVVNGDKCKLRYVNTITDHLGLPNRFRAFAIRGHSYHMLTATSEFVKRGLTDENCVAFWGGCKSDVNVPLVATHNIPVVSTSATGYVESNNSNMFSFIGGLNQTGTTSWLDIVRIGREENPMSSPHFVFPGTPQYSSVFSQ